MDLDRVVQELGIADSRDLLACEWDSSQRVMPAGVPGFLSPDFVSDACQALYLPDDITTSAVDAARRVAASPALMSLAWHCHHYLYHGPDIEGRVADNWPSLEAALGEADGMFYLLVLISHVPGMQAIHRAHRLPEAVLRESMDQVYQRGVTCSVQFGRWGLDGHAARWLSNYVRGNVYSLGRLAHQFGTVGDRIVVFRHVGSSDVIALSEGGVSYRADGQLRRDDEPEPEGVWTARFSETEREVVGYPIAPEGYAVRSEVRLKSSVWRPFLRRGDPALVFHIPGGRPLDHAQCGASFREALGFFPRYFPEVPIRALYCASWVLDAQLEDWLPTTANMVRFIREFYLCPGVISRHSILKAVLGGVPDDLSVAPRDTTLQRAIVDHLSRGRPMDPRGGKAFLFPEDLDWGSQVYRRDRFPRHLVGT